ncbi:MAG: hypothetical protein A2808_01845 [Candidatus Moranbacteria bacterium RIFCSPHIGHO2_01_FULL_55_24]|nr:MAG: hypothetical protein A2808_01845 [Candidatus Moranbacteria bacterium RIFCSPHIGHO2_01_FULL_55_24]
MSVPKKQLFLSRKNKSFLAAIQIGVFVSVFSFQIFSAPRALAWADAIPAAIMKQTMETIARSIEGALMGSLKLAAVQVINSTVGQLVGGNTLGQALIIVDYNDFLQRQPEQTADLFMNDFYTLTLRGKASSANYIGAGGTSGNVTGNYATYLKSQAEKTTNKKTTPTYNLDEYTSDPAKMFAEGDLRAFNAFYSNPANNPFGYSLLAEEAYVGKYSSEVEKQKIIATSSGFLPQTDKDGNVITPAASIEELVSKATGLPQDIIANASNPGELLSGVMMAAVNKTINGLVQKGVGKIQSNIQREIRNVDNQISGALNDATGRLGPAAVFIDETLKQRTNADINTNTSAPYGIEGSDGIY